MKRPTTISRTYAGAKTPGDSQPPQPNGHRQIRLGRAICKRLHNGESLDSIRGKYGPFAGEHYRRFLLHRGPLPGRKR